MPSTKDRILEALDCALDDISESRLLDILLDAYKNKVKQIEELEGANARERQRLHDAQESIRREHHEMRCNPLYGTQGQFFFFGRDARRFAVHTQGLSITMYERLPDGADWAMPQISAKEWHHSK